MVRPVLVESDRAQSEECALIEFDAIEYTEPGTYEYIIKELTPSGGGWITDNTAHRVIVQVDEIDGQLVARMDSPVPTFVNRKVRRGEHRPLQYFMPCAPCVGYLGYLSFIDYTGNIRYVGVVGNVCYIPFT